MAKKTTKRMSMAERDELDRIALQTMQGRSSSKPLTASQLASSIGAHACFAPSKTTGARRNSACKRSLDRLCDAGVVELVDNEGARGSARYKARPPLDVKAALKAPEPSPETTIAEVLSKLAPVPNKAAPPPPPPSVSDPTLAQSVFLDLRPVEALLVLRAVQDAAEQTLITDVHHVLEGVLPRLIRSITDSMIENGDLIDMMGGDS